MTDSGETAANAPSTQQIKAGFIRLLSSRIRAVSDDPQQMREIVYELARVKLMEQFTHADERESRELQQVLERAIKAVERSFARTAAPEPPKAAAAIAASPPPPVESPTPPPIPSSPVSAAQPPAKDAGASRRPVAPPQSLDQPKRSGTFTFLVRLAVILSLIASAGAAVTFWPRVKTQMAALSQLAQPSERVPTNPEPRPAATAPPLETGTVERLPHSAKEPAPAAQQPSMPLPTTFGVYALNEGQLQELKPVPGKIPDRRVAISAAINTPSAATLTSGDVRFVVFRPDGSIDASVTEVRVVAKVSRSMGVDASGKAAMVSAGDSWVIRSMSYPYKVGPVEDQPRMLLLQPEQDGFTLSPGRYVVVVKGMGYDFTVAGTITDPNQCVERINAANGAFYSPCPPPR
ncbi:hypothetical protein [Bradyrhizobium sp. 192]|uniref:hypothetical protein n=1 Tax=Bradyrhizobium sp. 192 TaxID=2782660 RepID=UPI001FFE8413|nr:hypothetical protein [Bradyrhizobium sp. 192]UPJ60261.1 hypothetical protein IVB24_11815 [Bradyrhizobium sp. 192]